MEDNSSSITTSFAREEPGVVSTGVRLVNGQQVRVTIRRGEYADVDAIVEKRDAIIREAGEIARAFFRER